MPRLRLFTFALGVLACAAHGQGMRFESEPNDTPESAERVTGAVTLAGTLPGNDQDGFRWTVSDVDAQQRWSLELQGVPGRLTVVDVYRLQFAASGELEDKAKLFTLGSRDGSAPVRYEDLLFEPGEYILGVASSGPGGGFRPPAGSVGFDEAGHATGAADDPQFTEGYRLQLHSGSRLYLYGGREENSTREQALDLRLDNEYASYRETLETWYRFELPAPDPQAEQVWQLDGQVPTGHDVTARLLDAAGSELAKTATSDLGRFRFADLQLDPGGYFVKLERPRAGMIEALRVSAVGQRVAGQEGEPNDDWTRANRIDDLQVVAGRLLDSGDKDLYRFVVDDDASDRLHTLRLENDSQQDLELCVLDRDGKRLQCRRSPGVVELPDLGLAAGQWGVSVGRARQETAYSLTLIPGDPIVDGLEREPNESLETATTVPARNRIKGRFASAERDTDFYRFLIDDQQPQLWRFQAIGDGLESLSYHDATGRRIQGFDALPGQRRLRLDNVFLLPGVHHIAVRGSGGGDYTLLARPLGPPDPNAELEPNDDSTRVQPLRLGQTRRGLLPDRGDEDNYRFHLANDEHIRLTVESPVDGQVKAYLYWDDHEIKVAQAEGGAAVLQGLFPPGDYRLRLATDKPSDADYRLSLERLERFSCPRDCEPNDGPHDAAPLPPDFRVEGSAGDWRDDDWYVLPTPETGTLLSLRNLDERWPNVRVFSGDTKRDLLQAGDDPAVKIATLPAGQPAWLQVGAWGMPSYRFELAFEGGPAAGVYGTHPDLRLDLQADAAQVAAYHRLGQRIQARIVLTNDATQAETVRLQAATSDWRWQAVLDSTQLTLEAGATRVIPLELQVPDDARADRPVRISVAARSTDGRLASAGVDIEAAADAALVSPRHHQPLPGALAGGFNAAWRALGARWADSHGDRVGTGFDFLFDGMAERGSGLRLRGGRDDAANVTIDLAGDDPVEVRGITLNLLSEHQLPRLLAAAELYLSLDGVEYTPALEVSLAPTKAEQAFLLDEPVMARFARLRLTKDFAGGDQIGLGEWKVIARPGQDLSPATGFNLLDPALGGHVVWAEPQISTSWDSAILTTEADADTVRVGAGRTLSWVVGFHHNRAARIQRLEWQALTDADPEERIDRVLVATSLDSPLGPWTPLGTWELGGDEALHQWILEAPAWARFVRFATLPRAEQAELAPPETLRIFEQATGTDYRSVLAEWGQDREQAFWESQQAILPEPEQTASANTSRNTALDLPPYETVSGRVRLDQQTAWYRVRSRDDDNTLFVTIEAQPTLRTRLHLEDAAGEALTLQRVEATTSRQVFAATVEPGADYFLRVEEPPRNVVFAWDTSGSVAAFLPYIYQALSSYAEDVVPGRDSVNLLPFGGQLLLDDWYSQPYMLQTTLNDYPRVESSSDAETTLHKASRGLAPRDGSRAVVLITDAATGRDPAVWQGFRAARPRVFTLGLSSVGALGGDPALYQDLLQDWSRVNGGHYQYVSTLGEMEIAFDRAATLLRGPAEYRLTVTSELREAPGPGLLRVVAGGGGPAPVSGAVELILDASGSMLKRLDGERRIAIAQRVLKHAVNESIPPGTPLALRVFGHREPNACRTDLELSLKPLDPAAASNAIDGIQARNLARTPIADSLAKVEGDLRGVDGPKIVILVTDGEETCDGDPAKVLEQLIDKGFDLRLNIVGFAIDDDALRSQFEGWARQGGGRYFDASDSASLQQSIDDALRQPFTVYDAAGEIVAEGFVGGEPLELPAGSYLVLLAGAGNAGGTEIKVIGASETVLEL